VCVCVCVCERERERERERKVREGGRGSPRESASGDAHGAEQTNVLLVSIKAGGTGLNLVSANHVFITDLWWNSAVESQVCDDDACFVVQSYLDHLLCLSVLY